ncbi:MAG: zinc ribbon domain-containing protein [Chloroflexi bacterium]|nr:zinc ribbon domain-containing protein [Chloroflexota bacterium]
MPTYQYRCEDCGITFDRFQHFSEQPLTTCPECGGSVHRVIQPVGIIFKGSGFYVTDHKASTANLMPKSEHGDSKAPEEKHSSESQGAKESEK